MIGRSLTIMCLIFLAGCEPNPISISNGKCWNLSSGDRISGTVTVVGIVDDTIIEGGASIQNTVCPERTMGLIVPDGPMLTTYRRSMKIDPPEFVERRFKLTGRILQNEGADRLYVEAESLVPAL